MSYYSEGLKLATTGSSTRADQAEKNRARFPEMAEFMLLYPGAKLRWARNAAGEEIGRRPELESSLFEISAETWTEMQRPEPAPRKFAK